MARHECGPAMSRMKIVFSSGTSTISNPGALKNEGPADGLQLTSGGYRSTRELRYSARAFAHGWNGTSAARGKPPRPGRTSQSPDFPGADPRLTWPSGKRGVGSAGAAAAA